MLCPKCGAEGATKKGGGRGYCAAGDHSFKLPPASLTQPDNLPEGVKLRGTSTLTDIRTGETVLQWVKTTADDERRAEMLAEMVKAMGEKLPKVSPRKASGNYRDELLTVYPIGDPHIGMCSWPAETGDDWNLKIAEQMHCDAMAELVRSAPASKQAVVVNLGDLYHRGGWLVARAQVSADMFAEAA